MSLIECEGCGGEMRECREYRVHDKFLGEFSVKALPEEYYCCAECDCEIVSYSLMKRIEAMEQERIEQLLLESVHGQIKQYKEHLIQNKELVQILGKSRQAIQQDGRIKTLIFHHVEKNGQILYWKESVEQYKRTGDGRFALFEKDVPETRDIQVLDSKKTLSIPLTKTTCTMYPPNLQDNVGKNQFRIYSSKEIIEENVRNG